MASTEVMLRWSGGMRSCCIPATSFWSCFGRRRASTLRLAWPSTMVTSMSATAASLLATLLASAPELQSPAVASKLLHEVEYCGNVKKLAKGDPAASVLLLRFLTLFWTSSAWRSCSSSFT
jgi:hypothetical protein